MHQLAWQQHAVAVVGTNQALQGGAFDCGIPASATAIQANFTAVAPSAAGYLRAWPYETTEPNATLLNLDPELGASNSLASAICPNCASEFRVKIYKGSTHLLMDVVGYYDVAC